MLSTVSASSLSSKKQKAKGGKSQPPGANGDKLKSLMADLKKLQGEKDALAEKIKSFHDGLEATTLRVKEVTAEIALLRALEQKEVQEAVNSQGHDFDLEPVGPKTSRNIKSRPVAPDGAEIVFQRAREPRAPGPRHSSKNNILVREYGADQLPSHIFANSVICRNIVSFLLSQIVLSVIISFQTGVVTIPFIEDIFLTICAFFSGGTWNEFAMRIYFMSVTGDLLNVYTIFRFVAIYWFPLLCILKGLQVLTNTCFYFGFEFSKAWTRWINLPFYMMIRTPVDEFVSARLIYLYISDLDYATGPEPDFAETERKPSKRAAYYKPALELETWLGVVYIDDLDEIVSPDLLRYNGRTKTQIISRAMLPALLNQKTLPRGMVDPRLMVDRVVRLTESSLRYVEDYTSLLANGMSMTRDTSRLAASIVTGRPDVTIADF